MAAACKAIRDERDKPSPEYPGEMYRVETVAAQLWPLFLVAKMHEEVSEIQREPKDAAEYGDLLQAMLDHAALFGIDYAQIETARLKKFGTAGSFIGRKVLVR